MVHTVENTVVDEDVIKAAYEEQRSANKKAGSELKQEPLSMANVVQEVPFLFL